MQPIQLVHHGVQKAVLILRLARQLEPTSRDQIDHVLFGTALRVQKILQPVQDQSMVRRQPGAILRRKLHVAVALLAGSFALRGIQE